MGPKQPLSTVLGPEDGAVVVAFRRHTLLPLDDRLHALQPSLPHLTPSSLHRCLQRHGISRLPDPKDGRAAKRRFKAYPIGFARIAAASPANFRGTAEVRTEQGKLHLFVAVDRRAKFAFAQLHEKATRRAAADLPHARAEALPYKLRSVLAKCGAFTRCGWFARVHRQPAGQDRPRNQGRHRCNLGRTRRAALLPSTAPAPNPASSTG